jgi:hypothetical protein
MAAAKVQILLNVDQRIREACLGKSDLAGCVDKAYTRDADVNAIRDKLRAAMKLPGPSDPPDSPSPAPPPAPSGNIFSRLFSRSDAPAPTEENVYCLFVAYKIREGDVAYSRAEQVPPECRKIQEVREALEAEQRAHPAFPISGQQTDKAILDLTRPLIDELEYNSNRGGTFQNQMPPGYEVQ